MNTGVLPACLPVYYIHAMPIEAKKGIGFPEARDTAVSLYVEPGKQIPCPLEEQLVRLSVKPSL